MFIRTLTRVPKCHNVQLRRVVLGLVPDSEMLVLLEQVGDPVLLPAASHMGLGGEGVQKWWDRGLETTGLFLSSFSPRSSLSYAFVSVARTAVCPLRSVSVTSCTADTPDPPSQTPVISGKGAQRQCQRMNVFFHCPLFLRAFHDSGITREHSSKRRKI